MPTLNINGQRVKVGDEFLSMTPDQQNAAVEEIASGLQSKSASAPVAAPASVRDGLAQQQAEMQPGFLRRVDDAVRGAADMLTFGFADEIAAKAGALTGIGGQAGDYVGNVAQQRQRDAEGGAARFAGQVAGALAIPGAAARSTLGAARQGAALGGVYGYGSGEGSTSDRLSSAALGAATGGAAGAAVRGVTNSLANRSARASIPTNESLRQAADQAYSIADQAGIVFRPKPIQNLGLKLRSDLTEFGYHPQLQPRIGAVLNEIDRLGEGNVTLKGVDVLRRMTQAAGSSSDPSERALAAKIVSRIDEMVENTQTADVMMGDVRTGIAALKEARSVWGRLRKSEAVDTAAMRADLRAASTGSGGNADNALRQNVRRLIENPKTARGMSQTERAAAERVVRGTGGQNALRLAGKLSPQGNGLMAALGIGGTMVNPAIGALSLGGMAAKTLADRGTIKNAEQLSEVIRSGGQTARQLVDMAMSGNGPPELVNSIRNLIQRDASVRAAVAPLAASIGDRVSP